MSQGTKMGTTYLERFYACMEYHSCDRRPNHELGVWPQTRERWQSEDSKAVKNFTWDWFRGEEDLNLDRREYVPVNFGFIPPFEEDKIEDVGEYELIRDSKGILKKALKKGTINGGRMSMDQYLEFPVKTLDDFHNIKRRLIAAMPERYPKDLDNLCKTWKSRNHLLVLGENCAANGFYWRAREFMGTENLSYAWYDQPKLMYEMMEFFCDFIIETARPVLEKIDIDYFTLNEDLSMKNGPLLSPDTFRKFIFPHLKRMVEFFRSYGVKYFVVDTDGNPTILVPLLMDAGIDTIWPLERASGVNPLEYRKKFGKSLRLWGGVDKREIAHGPKAIRSHLRELIPLIEEGGFIPTIDHSVPPDISWDNFRYYMDVKVALLSGDFGILEDKKIGY